MKAALVAILGLVMVGCAKFPASSGAAQGPRLIFTMRVSREIKTEGQPYTYVVALRPSLDRNPTTEGPLPVIAPPWGNGMVAGNATHFVRFEPFQSPRYILYAFDPGDPEMVRFGPAARHEPINWIDVEPGGAVLQFELDLSQLVPLADVDEYESIQINFLTMDRVPTGSQNVDKNWDALGTPLEAQSWITVPLRTSGVYDNDRPPFQDLEPEQDVPDPDLDIVHWSVEVRLP